MAKVLRDDAIVKNRIKENVNTALQRLSYYLDTAPTFVSYYHQEMIHSTADNNLDAVYQVAGSESPLKFNRIDKFPVYGLDQLSLNRDEGNFGAEADVSVDCIVLPGTIVPLENDLMSIDFVDKDTPRKSLYRIIKVEKAVQGTKSFFTITITFEPKTIELVEKQVEEELEYSVQDYEANRIPIFDSKLKHVLDCLRGIRAEFGKKYCDLFFEEKSSTFLMDLYYGKVVNFYLNYFIEKNEILEFDRFFFDTRTVFKYPKDISKLLANYYNKTIFRQIELHNVDDNTYEKQFLLEYSDKNPEGLFYSFPETYVECFFTPFNINGDDEELIDYKFILDGVRFLNLPKRIHVRGRYYIVDMDEDENIILTRTDEDDHGGGDDGSSKEVKPKCPHEMTRKEFKEWYENVRGTPDDHTDFILIRDHGEDDDDDDKDHDDKSLPSYIDIGDGFFIMQLKNKNFVRINPVKRIQDVVLNIYHHCYDDENGKIKWDELFADINKVDVSTRDEDFWVTPILLFYLKKFELIITIKEDSKKEWYRR